MQKRSFGQTKEGREVTEYTLVNAQGMTLSVIDLGATIVSITMKGSDGNVYDVVLGYDTPVDYQNNTCYFGAVIGRNANRIDHARIWMEKTIRWKQMTTRTICTADRTVFTQ